MTLRAGIFGGIPDIDLRVIVHAPMMGGRWLTER